MLTPIFSVLSARFLQKRQVGRDVNGFDCNSIACTAVKLSNSPGGIVVMPLSCKSKLVVQAQQPAQVTTPPLVSQHEAAALHGDGDVDEDSEGDCAPTNSAEKRNEASNSRHANTDTIV